MHIKNNNKRVKLKSFFAILQHGLLKNTARFLTLSRPRLTGRLLFRCIENCSEQTSITRNTR